MDCVKVQKCPVRSSTLYCRSPYGKSEGAAPSAAHCRRMAPSPLREESILQLSRRQSAARVSSTFLYLFNSLLVIRFFSFLSARAFRLMPRSILLSEVGILEIEVPWPV